MNRQKGRASRNTRVMVIQATAPFGHWSIRARRKFFMDSLSLVQNVQAGR